VVEFCAFKWSGGHFSVHMDMRRFVPSPLARAPFKLKTYSMSKVISSVESAKKAAAFRAVDEHLHASHRYIGIGSGSTVVYVVEAIISKGPGFYADMKFIPTGSQSKSLIRSAGLELCYLPERPFGADGKLIALDVAFDGADEVDDDLNCIKGGGACLLQEKGVAIRARNFIVVADYRKLSHRLCTKWHTGIPIEVDPFFAPDLLEELKALGSVNPTIRTGLPSKAGECVTDNGNWIIDAPFPPLLLPADIHEGQTTGPGEKTGWEVGTLGRTLKALEGVVEVGLFYGFDGIQAREQASSRAQKPIAAYFGMEHGEVEVRKSPSVVAQYHT
jgi:ribose 5-phosphate isomerase A